MLVYNLDRSFKKRYLKAAKEAIAETRAKWETFKKFDIIGYKDTGDSEDIRFLDTNGNSLDQVASCPLCYFSGDCNDVNIYDCYHCPLVVSDLWVDSEKLDAGFACVDILNSALKQRRIRPVMAAITKLESWVDEELAK